MGSLVDYFRALFARKPEAVAREVGEEQLRAAFRARYQSFKTLLASNNKALERMADMELALRDGRRFGMPFVRANTTVVVVNVYRMIQSLDVLSPGRYAELYSRYQAITEEINQVLAHAPPGEEGVLVIALEEIDRDKADQVGAKMANLGELRARFGVRTPPGFVITAAAFQRFLAAGGLSDEINRRLQIGKTDRMEHLYAASSDIQQLIIRSDIPGDVTEAVEQAARRLADEVPGVLRFAVRSSALGEDGVGTSFAGQYRSLLNVSPENLLEAYKEVVASKYSAQAISYRVTRGIRDEDVAMCVGCLVMVDARAGGVVYSRNPLVEGDDDVYVHTGWGLPKSVVDGRSFADLFVVRRGRLLEIKERRIAHKRHKFACDPSEGIVRMGLSAAEAESPSLDDARVLELAELALRLEEYFGAPRDIEWALDSGGEIVLLQCRGLKQIERGPISTRSAVQGAEVILTGGVTASPGAACGPVHWVRRDGDTLSLPEGAVMVTRQPLPRWAALLSQTAAVVAAEGGVAGHLATVAREMGVPALFGLGEDVAVLEEGQIVTVDASVAAVYEGRVESLLEAASPKSLMYGSPVYRTLEEVIRNIAPLTLIDPDGPDFRAASCRTLHDITRFCHEVSVQEMFAFDRHAYFPKHASKQLFFDVPMQWWIIDLDDGFLHEVPGKYVRLEDIACRPLLSLWEGMTEVPWEGPPALDAKGLAPVFFEAMANPELASMTDGSMANRNYFMIAKSFMTLYSRFGFHFSTVEAMLGEDPSENTVSFSFRGGAADFERRLGRVRFMGQFLEEHGFKVDIRHDAAFARVDGLDESATLQRLKMIGYLMMHTRQLDMIMSRTETVEYYRTKISRDLHQIAATS